MKPKLILLLLLLPGLSVTAKGQRTTFSANLNSGIFKYTGDESYETSGLTTFPSIWTQKEGTPGKKSGFSYEISGTLQRTTKSRFLFGAELAFQSLQAKTSVVARSAFPASSAFIFADGETSLTSQFICLTPFVGYRLLNKKVKMDLTPGFEMAACISRKEKIDAKDQNSPDIEYKANNDLSRRPDYRVRIQLNTSMGRIGLNTGYVIGTKNYYGKDPNIRPEAKSRFIRLGLSYCFN